MMPTNLRELLTAAIDGELSPAERKTARRLLKESEPARRLFAQLKADAARIKNLPRVAAPSDLADNVLNAIHDRAMPPTPLPPSRRRRGFNWSALPVWVNIASAACVLVVISLGSYLYFASSQDYYANIEKNKRVASNNLPGPEANSQARPEVKASVPETRPAPERLAMMPREVQLVEAGPNPRIVQPDIVVSPVVDPIPEIEPFDLNKIRVSQLFDLGEVASDAAVRKKLTAEIGRDELIRLDLFCQTTSKSLELVLAALKARGIGSISDSFVLDRLKRKSATEVMIFTEALTPDEVAQLLTSLGAEDQKSGAGEFSTLVAAPFLPADLEKLGKALGVPNVLPKPAKGKEGVDIRKPLPQGTADHVAATLSGMGTTVPRPRPQEKLAMVVAYSPMNANPSASKEIKQFLDRRGERASNAKPLMLVLRTTSK
jgi:hypothetical protein